MTRLRLSLLLLALTACSERRPDQPSRREAPTGGACEYDVVQTTCRLYRLIEERTGDDVRFTAVYAAPSTREPVMPAGTPDGAPVDVPAYETAERATSVPAADADRTRELLRAPVACEVRRIRSGACTPVSVRLLSAAGPPVP